MFSQRDTYLQELLSRDIDLRSLQSQPSPDPEALQSAKAEAAYSPGLASLMISLPYLSWVRRSLKEVTTKSKRRPRRMQLDRASSFPSYANCKNHPKRWAKPETFFVLIENVHQFRL